MSNDVNLVLLFDGTDNDLNDTVSLTNVAKLKKMIAYDGIMPEAFYSSGVGTQSNEKEGGCSYRKNGTVDCPAFGGTGKISERDGTGEKSLWEPDLPQGWQDF